MFRTRAAATAVAIAVSFGGATAALAPAALASSSQVATAAPASTGAFGSWAKAQKAAGFQLKKPTRLHGLSRTSTYNVSKCLLGGQPSKRVVDVQYGALKKGLLAIGQNNSGGSCSNLGGAKKLGTVKLFGVTGQMYGFCGKKGEVSCSSKKAEFVLTWKKGSNFYNTSSENETKATLVDFSKSLKNA